MFAGILQKKLLIHTPYVDKNINKIISNGLIIDIWTSKNTLIEATGTYLPNIKTNKSIYKFFVYFL